MFVGQPRQILVDRHICAVFDNVDRAVQRAQRRFAHIQNAVTLVERGRLTEDLLDSTQFQDILLRLHSRHMPLSWYYTYTPVQLVKGNKTELTFKFELWDRLNSNYGEWDLQAFPTRDSTFATSANIRSPVVTDAERKTLFLPTDCHGVKVKLCAISRLEKCACELGIISGARNPCQVEVTLSDLLMSIKHYRSNESVVIPDNHSTPVTLQCDGQRHRTVEVTNTELWWVHPKCTLETVNFTTYGLHSFNVHILIEYPPPVYT